MHTTTPRAWRSPGKTPGIAIFLGLLIISGLCVTDIAEAAGYPQGGYPPTGHQPAGYPPTGHQPAGYPPTGYPLAREAGYQDLRLNKAYFKGFLHDAGSVVTAPLSWRGSDWLKAALITGAAIAVAGEEDDLQHWVQTKRDDNTHFVADLAEPMGNGKYALPALGALYLYGRLSGRDRARRTALLSFESVIISCGITAAVKYLSHKHRPLETSTDDISWEGPSISAAYVSFPSGHSTCAFAIGTVVASEYRDNRLIPPLAYAAAALCRPTMKTPPRRSLQPRHFIERTSRRV